MPALPFIDDSISLGMLEWPLIESFSDKDHHGINTNILYNTFLRRIDHDCNP